MNTAWTLLKTTFKEWREDNATRLAAALSYYTAVAVAPLLIIVLSMASLFIDVQTVRQELSGQIQNVVGEQGGQILLNVLENADRPQAATLAGFFSFMVLLWGASNVFNQLQEALNTVWGVELKPETGIWTTVKKRFLSFGMILVIGFLLLVSLVLRTA